MTFRTHPLHISLNILGGVTPTHLLPFFPGQACRIRSSIARSRRFVFDAVVQLYIRRIKAVDDYVHIGVLYRIRHFK